MMKTLETTWEVWTYDVWGNAKDGWEVNDRCRVASGLEIMADVETFNAGTPQEFVAASLSDDDIREALGVTGPVEIDGDDVTYYVETEDGYPLGELHCTSHESLSPIGKRTDAA